MPTVKDVLDVARKDIGLTEYPPGSNTVKFNTEYYGRAVKDTPSTKYPWCCTAVWYWFKHSGNGDLFCGGRKTASCTTLYTFYKNHGQAVTNGKYKPGDIVFFNFSGKKNTDGSLKTEHVGVCEDFDGKYITCIEGNTSGSGSQDNGGAVLRKRRLVKGCVAGAARPNYDKEDDDDMDVERFAELMSEYRKAVLQDNDSSKYSADARAWVVENGIIQGKAGEEFNGMWQDFLTREQMATMLYRFAAKIGKV